MPKIDSNQVFRIGATVLLSLMSWIGMQVANRQADMSTRLHAVEMNQVKIMAKMDIEPCASTQNRVKTGSFVAAKSGP